MPGAPSQRPSTWPCTAAREVWCRPTCNRVQGRARAALKPAVVGLNLELVFAEPALACGNGVVPLVGHLRGAFLKMALKRERAKSD